MKKSPFLMTCFALVLSLPGCIGEDSETVTHTYPASGYDTVQITNSAGCIISRVKSDTLISMTLEKYGSGAYGGPSVEDLVIQIIEDTANRKLNVSINLPDNFDSRFEYLECNVNLSLPESLYVNLENSLNPEWGGRPDSLIATGHRAGMRLTALRGFIRTSNTAGEAELSCGSSIEIINHRGNIHAAADDTITGNIVMPAADGSCILESIDGDITLAVPNNVGARIRLETLTGTVEAVDTFATLEDTNPADSIFEAVTGDSSGIINLKSDSGAVTLGELEGK